MKQKDERRMEERVPIQLEVHLANAQDAARVFKAYSLNVSPGGICIRSTHRFKHGDCVQLSLSIANQHFHLSGQIAWVKDKVVGVRFEGVLPSEKLRLESVIWSAGQAL